MYVSRQVEQQRSLDIVDNNCALSSVQKKTKIESFALRTGNHEIVKLKKLKLFKIST